MSHYIDNSGRSAGITNDYASQILQNDGPSKLIRDELKRAQLGKYAKLLDLLAGAKGGKGGKNNPLGGGDIREQLMMLLEVILAEIDREIVGLLKDLAKMSKDMKKVTKKQAENNPGKIPSMNLDSSILQSKLTLKTQERQRFIEAINNALKSFHDADSNTIRRIV